MLTKDLITEIAAQTGMTKRRTEELLNATTNVVVENLLQGKSVQLQGLGALEIKEKSVSLSEASLKYDIPPQTIRRWRIIRPGFSAQS